MENAFQYTVVYLMTTTTSALATKWIPRDRPGLATVLAQQAAGYGPNKDAIPDA
jgi:hypothetical protein